MKLFSFVACARVWTGPHVEAAKARWKQVLFCNHISLCLKRGEKLITSPDNNLHLRKRKLKPHPHMSCVGVRGAERVLMDGEALFVDYRWGRWPVSMAESVMRW